MSGKVIYFAYGSNMSTKKIRDVVPSAKPIGQARLEGYRLVFNKKSVDGSSKANLIRSAGDKVWGVLYEMDEGELKRLDRSEGGYLRKFLEVIANAGGPVKAFAYLSSKLTNSLPYHWYKRLVVDGAREHNLPAAYVDVLEQLPSQPG
jgi:gamma-glutamylcyclotransferase